MSATESNKMIKRIKEKFEVIYSRFTVLVDCVVDKCINFIVSIEPLTDREHKLTLALLPFIFAAIISINFETVIPLTIFFWALYLFMIFETSITKNFSRLIAALARVGESKNSAPSTPALPACEVLMREANNPSFRSVNDPNYGRGMLGFW